MNGEKFDNVGQALLIDNVFNLVTKPRCYHKPILEVLRDTLIDMRDQCEYLDITKLAMPRIGCGLDCLDWDDVKELLFEVFEDSDIEILVCTL